MGDKPCPRSSPDRQPSDIYDPGEIVMSEDRPELQVSTLLILCRSDPQNVYTGYFCQNIGRPFEFCIRNVLHLNIKRSVLHQRFHTVSFSLVNRVSYSEVMRSRFLSRLRFHADVIR